MMDRFLIGLFAVVMLLLFGALCWIIYMVYDHFSAETFSLRKDHWVCAASHKETQLLLVGKVMVPNTFTVCDQWNRK